MAYVKRLVDRVIANDLGCPDLEFVWPEDREFDPLTAARIDDLALRNGSRTVNEVRDRLGLDTLPGGDQPMVLTPTGYVPLTPQPLGKGYFIEDLHPRQPLGSPGGIGGQFAPKDGADASVTDGSIDRTRAGTAEAAPRDENGVYYPNQDAGSVTLTGGGESEEEGGRRGGLLEDFLDPGAELRTLWYDNLSTSFARLVPGGAKGPAISDPNFVPSQRDLDVLEVLLREKQEEVAERIANGHAYDKHVIDRGNFQGYPVGISSQA